MCRDEKRREDNIDLRNDGRWKLMPSNRKMKKSFAINNLAIERVSQFFFLFYSKPPQIIKFMLSKGTVGKGIAEKLD